jgi:hypothetical protein
MPALDAKIGADASEMAREFELVGAMADRAGRRITSGIQGTHAGIGMNTIAMREILVLMREMSRGNWTRVPGSLSILLSQLGILKFLFKDNAAAAMIAAQGLTAVADESQAAALAAKAQVAANNLGMAGLNRVTESEMRAAAADVERAAAAEASAVADRAKAVAATQAAEAMTAEGGAAALSVGPIGWLVIGLIAAGTAAFFLVRHLRAVAEEQRNLRELLDTTTVSFHDHAEAIRRAAEEAQNFKDWLSGLADSETNWTDALEENLHALRERARFQRELAAERGMSKQGLAGMDIEAAKKELAVVEAFREQAQKNLAFHESEARQAEKDANDPDRAAHLGQLGTKAKQFESVIEELQKKMAEGVKEVDPSNRGSAVSSDAIRYRQRLGTAEDKFTVKGADGKDITVSLAEMQAKYKAVTDEETKLAALQKEKADLLARDKKLSNEDLQLLKRLNKESADLKSDIALKTEFLPQIAADKHNRAGEHAHLTANQQIGAYGGPAVMVGLQQTANRHLASIAKNTTPRPPGGSRAVGFSGEGVNFGDNQA